MGRDYWDDKREREREERRNTNNPWLKKLRPLDYVEQIKTPRFMYGFKN